MNNGMHYQEELQDLRGLVEGLEGFLLCYVRRNFDPRKAGQALWGLRAKLAQIKQKQAVAQVLDRVPGREQEWEAQGITRFSTDSVEK